MASAIIREETTTGDVRISRESELTASSALASVAAIACAALNVAVYGIGRNAGYVAVPLIYPAVMAVGQLGFRISGPEKKAWWLYVISISHVLLLSTLPSCLMVVMGSFEASGGAVLWAATAPLTSYVLFTARRTNLVFLSISLVTIAAAFATTGMEELGWIRFRDRLVIVRWHAVCMSFVTTVGICGYASALVSKLHHQLLVNKQTFERLVSEVAPAPVALKFQAEANDINSGALLPMRSYFSLTKASRSPSLNQINPTTDVRQESESCLYSGIFGPVSARKHQNISIVSVGVASFDSVLRVTEAEAIVDFLNHLFAVLDDEAKRFGMTKIRTVGHTYVVAAGMMSDYDFEQDSQHPELRSALFSLSVQRVARDSLQLPNGAACDLQVGVASGSVFSAVVGIRRPQFDVFGHVAEVADNLRRTCDSQCAQISAKAWESLHASIQISFQSLERIEGEHVEGSVRRMMGVAEDMWAVRLSHNQHVLSMIDRAFKSSSSSTGDSSVAVEIGSADKSENRRPLKPSRTFKMNVRSLLMFGVPPSPYLDKSSSASSLMDA